MPPAQEVPPIDVRLAADPSVGVAQPLFGSLLRCHSEVGTSCPVVQPSHPGLQFSHRMPQSSQLAVLEMEKMEEVV
jgi:hypothetical protein